MKMSEAQRERMAALVRYIPAFSDPATPMGEWHQLKAKPGTFSPPSFMPNTDAEQFVADCYAHGWVLGGFDWGAWAQTPEAQSLRNDLTALARANEYQLAQLLTVVIRQDRFVEGALAAALASGLILSILRRAQQLAGGAVIASGGPN